MEIEWLKLGLTNQSILCFFLARGHARIQKFHDLQRGRGDSREGSRGRDSRDDRQYHPYRR